VSETQHLKLGDLLLGQQPVG